MQQFSEEVINQIKENINLLEYIGNFVDLKKKGKLHVGLCPFHDEDTGSFSVFTDKNYWKCYGCGKNGDIITFVMNYYKYSYPKAVEYLINLIGLDISNIKGEPDTLRFLRKTYKTFNRNNKTSDDHEILTYDVFDQYSKSPIKEWIDEGICKEVLDEFDVRYDLRANRIVFPIFNNKGDLINVKGRTLYEEYKELGIVKYIYYYPLGKLDFLYGYYQNIAEIERSSEIFLFEGSKSVYKMKTWGVNNVCSIETSSINEEQIPSILSLKKHIVLCLDKGIKYEKALQEANKLRRHTNVSIVYDKAGLLKDKSSPCDEGYDKWLQLYENRIKL